ncbi:NADH-ubiquinone oxidoreductase complex I, 21 kDa subunit-domain-containing protein [Mrakia frigida]|uniref:NADH-ubiquinone oxidoreductase complex I, 21 kDa subunit-domain-containing protein n=1 Tax=Mrakia frigida TaxID=29902 RepID=UPI003FCC0016
MVIKRDPTRFPLIDSDPHAKRVIRYMRSSDYALWASCIAAGQGLWFMNRRVDPKLGAYQGLIGYKIAAIVFGTGGFLWAYRNSSFRFMGIKENARELQLDWEEMRARIQDNQPLYGYSRLSDYGQSATMRMSTNSQWMLHLVPFFNLTNHRFHDTDQDYYQGIEHLRPKDYRTSFIGA